MTDRELLERAAKAAGFALEWDGPPDLWQSMFYKGKTYHEWNPLVDDGDALRLAVKLNLWEPVMFGRRTELAPDGDIYAATRRAIVRAAAALADTEPPDHLAVMRQALEALEERYVGALRDSAIDALRVALGEK